jgi:hypothetical protein
MIQDDNLYEGMRRFFRRLPNYYVIAEDEQIELFWTTLDKNQPAIRECFPNLKQALQRAISLGPAHHMVLQAVIEPGTLPWETDSTQTLAVWRHAPGRSGSNGVATLRALPFVEPSTHWFEYFSDGVSTYEASWFYYHSRCPIRAQTEERRSRQDEGD